MLFFRLTQIMLVVCMLSYGVLAAGPDEQPSPKELKVLVIGNSFSQSVMTYLPKVAASVPGCRLKICSVYIGGCSFERHWESLNKSLKDPKFKPYSVILQQDGWEKGKYFRSSLNAMVTADKWDIITVQQASRKSIDYKHYQPYADDLIRYLRKYAPQAEIVIQQTWSYRSDSRRLKVWKITQKEMYEKLDAAYRKLAAKHNFRIIPSGLAVELFRRYTPVKFVAPSRAELKALVYPQLPSTAGDTVGYPRWRYPKDPAKRSFLNDDVHLNHHGQYMQACVWFSCLFQRPVSDIKFAPADFKAADVELLKKCAEEAVKTYPQIKK